MEKKMTKREVLEMIKNYINGEVDLTDEMAAEIVNYVDTTIAQLENKAVKANERAKQRRAESDEIRAMVHGLLTDELQTVDEICAQVEDESITKSKVIPRLSQLAKDGLAVKDEIKTEAGNRVAYKLA